MLNDGLGAFADRIAKSGQAGTKREADKLLRRP